MTKKTSNRFSPEVRQRAVRMVLEHAGDHASQRAAIGSIAAKIGCTAETLRKWVRQAEREGGQRPDATTEERERIKVLEHGGDHASQWSAIGSIAGKIGCTAETLRKWVRQGERDMGQRPGGTTEERERIKALERENRELRQANEILKKASAYFAVAELDRRSKP